MSCGSPHEVDCAEVLALVDALVDGEVAPEDHDRVVAHLQECSPCLKDYDVERMVKALVSRSCACQPAPEDLRSRVVARIREVSVRYSRVERFTDDGRSTTYESFESLTYRIDD